MIIMIKKFNMNMFNQCNKQVLIIAMSMMPIGSIIMCGESSYMGRLIVFDADDVKHIRSLILFVRPFTQPLVFDKFLGAHTLLRFAYVDDQQLLNQCLCFHRFISVPSRSYLHFFSYIIVDSIAVMINLLRNIRVWKLIIEDLVYQYTNAATISLLHSFNILICLL